MALESTASAYSSNVLFQGLALWSSVRLTSSSLAVNNPSDRRCYCGGSDDDYTRYGDELDAIECNMPCSGKRARGINEKGFKGRVK